jgi:hypothetical protein
VNSITERWVQTCRHELLDRTLIWNHRHLLRALREFEQFCNETSGSRILKVDWKRTCWSWPAVEGVGTRVERCLNAPVIELVGLFVAAGLTGWLFRRKAKQRDQGSLHARASLACRPVASGADAHRPLHDGLGAPYQGRGGNITSGRVAAGQPAFTFAARSNEDQRWVQDR